MILTCPACRLRYDDERRVPACPHPLLPRPLPTLSPPAQLNLDRKLAAIQLLGKRVRVCAEGYSPSSPPLLIRSVGWDGRIALYGRKGEYLPEELEAVEESHDCPLKEI